MTNAEKKLQLQLRGLSWYMGMAAGITNMSILKHYGFTGVGMAISCGACLVLLVVDDLITMVLERP